MTQVARRVTTPLILLGLAALVVAGLCLRLAHGSTDIPLADVVAALTGGHVSAITHTVVWQLRLPVAITACVTGAALGVAGLQMQTLFGNPLADPYVLGVSSGASLGVATMMLLPGFALPMVAGKVRLHGSLATSVAAIIGAALVMGVVLAVGATMRSATFLLLLGVMFASLTSAVVMVLLAAARPELVAEFVSWQFGSYQGVTRSALSFYAPVLLVAIVLSWVVAPLLNVAQTGERYASSMGLNVRALRVGVVLLTAVLAGTTTAWCGPIQFLGIAVPHIARQIMRTADQRILVPATALVGAALAVGVDAAAVLPDKHVLPLNAANAAVGAPIVIWVLWRAARRGSL